jgi:flagellar protein FliO/FliZ
MTGDMLFRMLFALVLVLGLLGAFAVVLRVWGHKLGLVMLAAPRGDKKRIQLQESVMLDAKHRLVIVRCDDADHMVILGGATPVVLPASANAGKTCADTPSA